MMRATWSRRSIIAVSALAAVAADLGGVLAARVGVGVGERPRGDAPVARDRPVATTAASGAPVASSTSVVDVTSPPYRVVADGATDWSSALSQAAADLAHAGGGLIQLPAGVIVAENLPCYSHVAWEGRGMGTTVVQLKAGSTGHVFVTDGFSALIGTARQAGPVNWAIRHLTIDGSRDFSPRGGHGIAAFGYEFAISDVLIRRCHGHGAYLEYDDAEAGRYGETSMESYIDRVKVLDCDGSGFWIEGMHDSYWTNCIAVRNGSNGMANFRVSGGSTNFSGCHAWGSATFGWLIEGRAQLHNCQGEGAASTNFAITGDDVSIVGGHCFWPEQGATGISIGTPQHRSGNVQIRGMVVDRGSERDPVDFSVALDVRNAGRGCRLDLSITHVTGTAVAGPLPSDADASIRITTAGRDASIHRFPGQS